MVTKRGFLRIIGSVQIRVSSNVLILKVEQTGRVWKRVIMIIDCVHNLCFDRLADGSCGILCQPLSGSPELFFSETSRQQGMLKLFRFK